MNIEIQIYKYSETTVICLNNFTDLYVHLVGFINFNLTILDFRNHSFVKSYIYTIYLERCVNGASLYLINDINRGNNTLMQY